VGLLALLFSAAVLIGLDHYRLGTYVGLAAALWFAARWTQGERIAGQARKRGMEASLADRYGWLLLDSKWHQVRGMIDFLWRRWRGKRAEVISYKESTAPAA
jgi:hypothetical protein